MEAKDKAIELVEKFAKIQRDFNQQNYYGQAKKCALICVDEMLGMAEIPFLEQVKQEINLL